LPCSYYCYSVKSSLWTRGLDIDALVLEHLSLFLLDLLVDLGTPRRLVAVLACSVGRLLLVLGLLPFGLLLGLLAGLGELVLQRLLVLGISGLVRLGLALLVVLAVISVVVSDIVVGTGGVALVTVIAVDS